MAELQGQGMMISRHHLAPAKKNPGGLQLNEQYGHCQITIPWFKTTVIMGPPMYVALVGAQQ